MTLDSAAEVLATSPKTIALTGAGMSCESGIPDFRSPGGLWSRYPPEQFATIEAFHENPRRLWQLWRELGKNLQHAEPNAGHYALAELEHMEKLAAIITQNIDNLHQRAGSRRVIEYHGNAYRLYCPRCHRREPLQIETLTDEPPTCVCGTIMKPDVVLFGEWIPPYALLESEALAQSCHVMWVIGTSAQVYPAAELPYTAKRHGATVIECNITPTDFTETITDIFLQGPAGTVIPEVVQRVKALLG